ncbi:serine/threonine protein kinase, partial [Micromonospora mangrovi]
RPPQVLPTYDPIVPPTTASPTAVETGTASSSAPPTRVRPPVVTSSPPAPPGGTVVEAADRVDGLIEEGLSAGQIRSDVGIDLRNLLRIAANATNQADLTVAVARLRDKIVERRREGSVSPAYAGRLDAAAAELGAART